MVVSKSSLSPLHIALTFAHSASHFTTNVNVFVMQSNATFYRIIWQYRISADYRVFHEIRRKAKAFDVSTKNVVHKQKESIFGQLTATGIDAGPDSAVKNHEPVQWLSWIQQFILE